MAGAWNCTKLRFDGIFCSVSFVVLILFTPCCILNQTLGAQNCNELRFDEILSGVSFVVLPLFTPSFILNHIRK